MILEMTSYYPRAGCEDEVLAHRRRGAALRARLGLPQGEVLERIDGEGAPVRWICRYPDEAAFRADLARRAESAAFSQQIKEMSGLIERFERSVYRLDDEG